jgi:exopolysaccharide production protein ExoZ
LGLVFRRRLLGVLLTLAVLVAAVLWGATAKPADPLAQFYTTPMIVEFGLGMLLGLAWPHLKPGRGASIVLGAAALAAFAFMLAGPLLWPQVERLFAFGLPAAMIVAACLALERSGFALRWEWPRLLGNASYAIYLSHFFVTQAVVLLARKAHLHGPPEIALAMGAALAGVAVVGVGLHYSLERGADIFIASLVRRPSAAKLSFR